MAAAPPKAVHGGDCTTMPPPLGPAPAETFNTLPAPGPIKQVTAGSPAAALLKRDALGWLARPGMKYTELGPIVLVGDVSDQVLQRSAADLRKSIDVTTRVYGDAIPLEPRRLVLVPASARDFGRAARDSPRGWLGFMQYSDQTTYIGIGPDTRSGSPYVGERPSSVMTHELMHLTTVSYAYSDMPAWLTEGYAEIAAEVQDPRVRQENDRTIRGARLRIPDEDALYGDEPGLPYALSASFVRYLCSIKGSRQLGTFVRNVTNRAWQIDTFAKNTYGHTIDELVPGWKAWVARTNKR
ncbi:hypothetical protein VV02_02565 [Luteipulveratus mongoliensis]|uniref:Peptidase MA-like domain-containing protein n=1 Tax=Luteipulveratus mongoliensis TaxID=571913 RepID=A0A0K1JEI8_9MICO|nr:hypothetical protein VV02_02565 [Luteipulveratus mongoliensis]